LCASSRSDNKPILPWPAPDGDWDFLSGAAVVKSQEIAGGKMRHRLLLSLLLCAPIGCQQINWDAASGIKSPVVPMGGSGGGAAGMGGTAGNTGGTGIAQIMDAGPSVPDRGQCDTITAGAYGIVKNNCSACHQDAGSLGGPLTFILDLPRLMNVISGVYNKPYLVPGDPDKSLVFFRVDTDAMPPAYAPQRPSRETDLPVLRDFIAKCLPFGAPYTGWPAVGVGIDAAPPLGPPGEDNGPCLAANTCNNGGCCVYGLCRASGKACGLTATNELVPGICMSGSCGEPTSRCGSLNQICCPPTGKCTAPHTACGPRTKLCEPCGDMGQACCDFGGPPVFCANVHLSCIGGGGGGNPGACLPCGAPGIDCCGEGTTSAKKCDNGAACIRIAGTGPGTGDICPGGNTPDAGRDAGRGN
jgi:hypothetical protein